MDSILIFLQTHAPIILEHKYLFLFIASILEGFNTLVIAGFLVSVGGLSLIPAALVCLAGEVVSGFVWYTIGYFGGSKSVEWFVQRNPRRRQFIERARHYLDQHTGKLILFAKFTFSLTIATLIMVGSIKYNVKKFAFYNVVGSFGWVVITFGLGTFFGEGYKIYAHYLKEIGFLIIFAVLAIALIVWIEKKSGSMISRTFDFEDHLHHFNERIWGMAKRFMEGPDDRI